MPVKAQSGMPCAYCEYSAVCKRDISNGASEEIKTLKDEEVWEKLEVDGNVD